MNFQLITGEHRFIYPFQLAHGTRLGTENCLLRIEHNECIGWGEATFPPYLNETKENSVQQLQPVINQLNAKSVTDINEVYAFSERFHLSPFTRTLLVNAFLDLFAQLKKTSTKELLGIHLNKNYRATYTLTKSSIDKALNSTISHEFSAYKLKLDGKDDLEFIQHYRKKTSRPFCADANQGWENLPMNECLRLCEILAEENCLLIEQPFAANNHLKHEELRNHRLIPVVADEGLWTLEEFKQHHSAYDGINIKPLKCGGLDKAKEIADFAIENNKKIILGCMSESTCGCAATFSLAGYADFLDLDGPWLINNDPFEGLEIKNGIMSTRFKFGNGIKHKNHE